MHRVKHGTNMIQILQRGGMYTMLTVYVQLWIATGHNFESEERRCRRKSFYERTET